MVEDDERLLASLKQGLVEAGMAVDAVQDGEEAVAAGTVTPYDVIVLDVMLPGLDGYEVSRRLRQSRVSTPILMLTALDSVDAKVRGLERGADDYLVKPFAIEELKARVRALSRRHLAGRSATLEAGPLVLDTSAHRLSANGRQVALTGKEFQILELLMRHPGQLLSRRQILENVWDYDFDGGRNLVEVYVGRLRGKLQAVGVDDPFVTVRGVGYRLEPV